MGIAVKDPFEIRGDTAMPFLLKAIDPSTVYPHLKACLMQFYGKNINTELGAIRVRRYEAGHYCSVEYDLAVESCGHLIEELTIIGKMKSGTLDTLNYQILRALWKGGFDVSHIDQICVPEPVGLIPQLQMWLHRKAPGVRVKTLLHGAEGIALSRRIAEALNKLHRMNVTCYGCHTLVDELRLLHQRLASLSTLKPEWENRLKQIRTSAEQIASSIPRTQLRGIHRDFDLNHLLVDGSRMYLIGFERYCKGDPALDAGNFLAHLTEHGFRHSEEGNALLAMQKTLEERFFELAGSWNRPAVEAYKMLRLIRQIYVASQLNQENIETEGLMDAYLDRYRSVASTISCRPTSSLPRHTALLN